MTRLLRQGRSACAAAGLLLLLLLAALGGLVALATPAAAHPALVSTEPAAGYTVATAPDEVALVFSEPVEVTGSGVVVGDVGAGGEVRTSAAREVGGGERVVAAPARPLAPGAYQVTWQVVAQDGDVVTGTFTFGVAHPEVAEGSAADSVLLPDQGADSGVQTSGLASGAALRWLLFTGLALALGGLVGERLTRRTTVTGEAQPRAPVAFGSLVAAVSALGLALHHSGGGDPVAGLGSLSIPQLAGSSAGRTVLVELLAALAAAVLASGRRTRLLAALPLLGLVTAEGVRSHIGAAGSPAGPVLVGVHLAAAAVWVGALLHVVRVGVVRRRIPRDLLRGYAGVAAVLFAVVVVTGTAASLLLLDAPADLLRTTYGQALLVKLALVVAAAGLALLGRQRLRQDRTHGWAGRVGRAEGAVLVGVLAAAAVLVSVPPPATATAEMALPPPPVSGPALSVGTLVGHVTLGVTASAGQLELRASVPADNPDSSPAYDIRAWTGPDADRTRLSLRSCGEGCFAGPASWRRGDNRLRVDVEADGWTGGSTTLTVPWPLETDAEVLPRALETMATVPSFELVEQVTSDTSGGPGVSTTLPMTGARFLDSEPYSADGVRDVVVLHRGASTEIAFAVPADRIYVQLEIGPEGRILREVLTAPNHLITREFRYA